MRTITLNDGTVVDGTILDNNDGVKIFVYLTGKTLAEGYMLMSDNAKTERMTFHEYDIDTVFEGYTEIVAINTTTISCNLVMRKPA